MNQNEIFKTTEPEALECKDCKFALGRVVVGSITVERYAYSVCGKYGHKPEAVLWKGAKCPEKEAIPDGG